MKYIGILSDSDQIAALSSQKWASPLGQVVLATEMENRGIPSRVYNLDVNRLDLIQADMRQFLNGGDRLLVGLTLITGNVDRSLRLACWLKEKYGATVIVGGPEITRMTASYYISFPYIDGAVIGVANNAVFDAMAVGWNGQSILDMTDTMFDFSVPVDYRLIFRLREDYGGVSFIWGGDCALCNHRCYFCSRGKRGFGFREQDQVWNDLKYPMEIGMRYSYNTADTVAANIKALRAFAESRPLELAGMTQKAFINATQVNEETIRLLRKLEAYAAIGIESFGNLKAANKGATTDDHNMRAIELCYKNGVPMIMTFVAGLPGETEDSLRINEKEINSIAEKYGDGIHMITVSPLLISIGSRAYDYVVAAGGLIRRPGKDTAYYDPLAMSDWFYENRTDVKRPEIIRSIKRIHDQVHSVAPAIKFDSKGISPDEKAFIQGIPVERCEEIV